MNNEDKILKFLENMQQDIKSIKTELKEHGEDIKLIKTQLKEHGEMLSSLQKASEFHKADIDNLSIQLAKSEGNINNKLDEINAKIDNLTDTNKSLLEMYGEHEAEIRTLKRRVI